MSKVLDIPTPGEVAEGFVFDLSGVTLGDFMDYMDNTRTGDVAASVEFMVKIIKAWPYDGNPSNPDDYRRLPVTAYGTLLTECGKAVVGGITGN